MKWIRFSERLPKPRSKILIYDVGTNWMGTFVVGRFPERITQQSYHSDADYTHWMPLPEPPK